MKTSLIAVLVVGVVAAGAYFVLNSPESKSPTGSTGDTNNPAGIVEEGENQFSGSFSDLVKRGGNYMCTFDHQTAQANSSGTLYISGDDLRGDFLTSTQGMNIETHMIQKDGSLYTWSPIAPTGFKMQVVAQAPANGNPALQAQYADMNQVYSYDCDFWTADNSKFALPAGVTFTAIN